MTDLTDADIVNVIRAERKAEREICAAAIEAMRSPESGPDYDLAADDERRAARYRNNVLTETAKRIRDNL